jgi:lipoyl(octanoyl) transferase
VLTVRDLGRMPYAEAFSLQKELQRRVIEGRGGGAPAPMHLLLLEHDPPVITVTRRPGAAQNLLARPEDLAAAGVEVAPTDRGGDITYHGPGQLVAYAILDLNALGLRPHGYMRLLEQSVIDVLARFGIEAGRDPAATGVWAGDPPAKVCALGVRIARWVSMHGLALNVTTDLSHFGLIVPCGLAGRGVTSMERLLGERCPSLNEVKRVLAETLSAALERHAAASIRSASP